VTVAWRPGNQTCLRTLGEFGDVCHNVGLRKRNVSSMQKLPLVIVSYSRGGILRLKANLTARR